MAPLKPAQSSTRRPGCPVVPAGRATSRAASGRGLTQPPPAEAQVDLLTESLEMRFDSLHPLFLQHLLYPRGAIELLGARISREKDRLVFTRPAQVESRVDGRVDHVG